MRLDFGMFRTLHGILDLYASYFEYRTSDNILNAIQVKEHCRLILSVLERA
jgi:hypothetical protein